MQTILPAPPRYAVRLNPITGIDWKHESENTGECYRRTFGNLAELLAFVADRYGRRMENKIAKLKLSAEWQGKLTK